MATTDGLPVAARSSVACTSGSCVAAGYYEDSASFHEGLLLTGTS